MQYKHYIFDIDGTITDGYDSANPEQVKPIVAEWFSTLPGDKMRLKMSFVFAKDFFNHTMLKLGI